MGKIAYILVAFITVTTTVSAQTKLIAHKSHSGSDADFAWVLRDDPSAYINDNFGVVGDEPKVVFALDSVIRVNDTTTVMVISSDVYYTYKANRVEKAPSYHDTVYHHPALQGKRSLSDARKAMIKHGNQYANPIDSVKFIGFDEEKTPGKKNRNSMLPVSMDDHTGLPPALPSVLFLGILVLISSVAGMVYYRFDKLKQSLR